MTVLAPLPGVLIERIPLPTRGARFLALSDWLLGKDERLFQAVAVSIVHLTTCGAPGHRLDAQKATDHPECRCDRCPAAQELVEWLLGPVVGTSTARLREPLRPWVREWIFRRDQSRCVRCASTFDIQIDHIVELASGGTDEAENLQTLCKWCHLIKTVAFIQGRKAQREVR
jgi:5-methylcytosine-specific restriction endonuclease McrA